MKSLNLIGQRFGRLVPILKTDKRDRNGNIVWLCKCDCGKEKNIVGTNLTRKIGTRSCGCLQKEETGHKLIDLVGQKFNRLTPIQRIGTDKFGHPMWLCLCDCKNKTVVSGDNLRSGRIKSCGCFKKETNKINKNCWKKEEDDILKKFYCDNGASYVSKLLKRTKASIVVRAMKFHLTVNYARSTGLLKKIIIKKIKNNRVLSLCKIHGESNHYYRNGKIQNCILCCNIRKNAYRKRPINNFVCRLRGSIRSAFNRISRQNGEKRKTGAMRHLDYTSKELYDYLSNIQKLQNNKCPICQTNYEKCILSIDHVIPLITAKTEQEIISLFDLKNLNLMCKNCNSSKNDKSYTAWARNRYV